jgi:hypothetical protein
LIVRFIGSTCPPVRGRVHPGLAMFGAVFPADAVEGASVLLAIGEPDGPRPSSLEPMAPPMARRLNLDRLGLSPSMAGGG